MDVVVGIGVIALLVVAGLFFNKRANNKRKAEEWTGTVEAKKTSDIRDSDGDKVGVSYDVTFRKSDGKKRKMSVAQSAYDVLNVGDAVEKRVGEMDPVKKAA